MMRPAAQIRMRQAPGALDEVRLSARPQLPNDTLGNHSDAFEFTNPRLPVQKQLRGNLGAVNRVPRPLSFPSNPDHLAHVSVTPVMPSLVADDEHDAWSSHGAGKITHEGASRG